MDDRGNGRQTGKVRQVFVRPRSYCRQNTVLHARPKSEPVPVHFPVHFPVHVPAHVRPKRAYYEYATSPLS